MVSQVEPNILTFVYQFLFIFWEGGNTPWGVGRKFAM